VLRHRDHFVIARRFVNPECFVFLDESCAQTNLTRLDGRAPIGERCLFAAPQGHWHTTTLLSAMRIDGVMNDASIVFDGPINAMIFRSCVEECLAPSLRPGDIVIMDNLASHKVSGVVEAIDAVGASIWYLPPYSPDLNPIEKLWAKIKAWLRRVAARTMERLIQAVGAPDKTDDTRMPLLDGKSRRQGHSTAYVCENYHCQAPAITKEELEAQLPH